MNVLLVKMELDPVMDVTEQDSVVRIMDFSLMKCFPVSSYSPNPEVGEKMISCGGFLELFY